MKIKHRTLVALGLLSLMMGCVSMYRPTLSQIEKFNKAVEVSGMIGCSPEDINVLDFFYTAQATFGKFTCDGDVFICSEAANNVKSFVFNPTPGHGMKCT